MSTSVVFKEICKDVIFSTHPLYLDLKSSIRVMPLSLVMGVMKNRLEFAERY
jgi:hypothetical protein